MELEFLTAGIETEERYSFSIETRNDEMGGEE